jgi:hypothetical protein
MRSCSYERALLVRRQTTSKILTIKKESGGKQVLLLRWPNTTGFWFGFRLFQASAQMPPRGIYSNVTLPYLMRVPSTHRHFKIKRISKNRPVWLSRGSSTCQWTFLNHACWDFFPLVHLMLLALSIILCPSGLASVHKHQDWGSKEQIIWECALPSKHLQRVYKGG